MQPITLHLEEFHRIRPMRKISSTHTGRQWKHRYNNLEEKNENYVQENTIYVYAQTAWMLNRFSKYRPVPERSNAHLLFGSGHSLSLSLSLNTTSFSNKKLTVWCKFQVNRKSFAHAKLLSTFLILPIHPMHLTFWSWLRPAVPPPPPLPDPLTSREAATSEIDRGWYTTQNNLKYWIRFEYIYVVSIQYTVNLYVGISVWVSCRKV